MVRNARPVDCPAIPFPPSTATESDGTPVSGLVAVTYATWVRVLSELARMVPFLGETASTGCLRRIRLAAAEALGRIEEGIIHGSVQPFSSIRVSPDAPQPPLTPTAPRIGVLPLASSPFEWSHLLAGLAAVAQLQLDHVVYIVTENPGRNASLLPREMRHEMTRRTLEKFPPLLLYSPIGLSAEGAGLLSVFSLLRLNAFQPMEMFLITGGLESRLGELPSARVREEIRASMADPANGYDDSMHPLSLVVSRAGHAALPVARSPAIVPLDFPMPSALPGAIPAALSGETGRDVLAALPYTAFRHMRRLRVHAAAQTA